MSAKGKSTKKRPTTASTSASSSDPKKPKSNGESDETFMDGIHSNRMALCSSVADFKFNKKRVRILSTNEDVSVDCKAIVYWMSRDQRVQDNWALLYAQRLSLKVKCPLIVCFCLVPKFLEATIRQFGFLIKGLQEVESECKSLKIPFVLLLGAAPQVLPQFIEKHNVGALVADFSPLRVPLSWVEGVKKALPSNVPFCQVDAHNLVPCWVASDKLEYGARTIRKKIMDKLPEYLTEFPPIIEHPHSLSGNFPDHVNWESALSFLEVDRSIKEVKWAVPGTNFGLKQLKQFCDGKLKEFAETRNDPNKKSLSNLSPWIHFGQISAQRCILQVQKYKKKFPKSVEAYVEETVVRRELADNFCLFCPKYDSLEGAWSWAQKTLKDHVKDKREYLYTKEEFEKGQTHDQLWNAAQLQMVTEGKMHGFMRMYWAKKILEWTESPKEALALAIYLNDKYELDGRDPNGYVGCMWSICGLHDQGWGERPVFGKIRFMNFKGCKRKFDVQQFIDEYC